jgi:general stress protein CsbA
VLLLFTLTLNYEVFPCLLVGWFSRVTLMRKKRKGQDTLKEEEPEEERK